MRFIAAEKIQRGEPVFVVGHTVVEYMVVRATRIAAPHCPTAGRDYDHGEEIKDLIWDQSDSPKTMAPIGV